MIYVVRFGRMPMMHNLKEAKIVEAHSELDAILAVATMLLRRGDDPVGFSPIGRICGLHKELGKKCKYLGERYNGEALIKHIEMEDESRRSMISEAIAECVEEFTPEPSGTKIIG